MTFYLSLLKELLLSPSLLVAWSQDDDHGLKQPLVVTLLASVLTTLVTVRSVTAQALSGASLGVLGTVVVALFVFMTMVGTLYFSGLIYFDSAKIFGSRDATYGQGVRLAAGGLWLSAALTLPATLFTGESATTGLVLLAVALLYVLYITGRGLIQAMGAHPAPVWVVGSVLGLLTLAYPLAIPAMAERNRAAQQEYAQARQAAREAEVNRKAWEMEHGVTDPAQLAAANAESDRRSAERRERERAEQARLRERVAQAAAAKGGDYLEVRINSIPPNAQVATKDGQEQFGPTPTRAKFHKSRFPVMLTLTAPNGKQVDYEVSSLQGAVMVMIGE